MTAPQPANVSSSLPQTTGKRRTWVWVMGIATAFLVGVGAGAATENTESIAPMAQPATQTVTAPPETVTVPAETITETVTPAPETIVETAPPAAPVAASLPDGAIGEGVWRVGEDVDPGTYRTNGPDSSGLDMCFWKRSSDASGEADSIITGDLLQGPGVVTIESGEVFTSQGCSPWTRS